MDATTFTDPNIVKYMNEHYYSVKLDAERVDKVTLDGKVYSNPNPGQRRSSHELAVQLLQGKMSYPSYVFINEKNEWLTKVPGYMKAHTFEPVVHFFGDGDYLTKKWEVYSAGFKGEIPAEQSRSIDKSGLFLSFFVKLNVLIFLFISVIIT